MPGKSELRLHELPPDYHPFHAPYARNFWVSRALTTEEHGEFCRRMGEAGEALLVEILSDQENPLPLRRLPNE